MYMYYMVRLIVRKSVEMILLLQIPDLVSNIAADALVLCIADHQ